MNFCMNSKKRIVIKLIKEEKRIINIIYKFRDLSTLITVIMSALLAVEINILTSDRELALCIHLWLVVAIFSLAVLLCLHVWVTTRYDEAKDIILLCYGDEKRSAINPWLAISHSEKNRILKSLDKREGMSRVICAYLFLLILSIGGTFYSIYKIVEYQNISKANGTRIENCCKCLDCPYTQEITNDSHITTRDSSLPSNNYYSDSTSVVEPTIQIPERMTEVDIMPEVIDEPHIHP